MATHEHKREYVRQRRKSAPGDHHCHWPGCEKKCPAAQWGCYSCWMKLPKRLRDKIWAAFKPGQEETKTPSREYIAVAREVQEWILENFPPSQGDNSSDWLF